MPKLPNRVREFRRRLGWTLQQLSRASGLSVSYIWEIENGQAVPSLVTARRLALALGQPLDAVFPQSGEVA